MQKSYYVPNIYPASQIDEYSLVIVDTINNDISSLCLSGGYFLFNNHILILQDSGLIDLNLIVVKSEVFLQRIKSKPILQTH